MSFQPVTLHLPLVARGKFSNTRKRNSRGRIAVAEPQTPARARSSALTTAALPAVLTLSWTGALTILLAAPSNAV
jgi:hypothetical protein